jgi:glutaredoxin 3
MKTVTVYTKIPCPYCEHAKKFLKARDIPFNLIDLTDKPDEMARIKKQTGWSTVPIILVGEKLIGGFSDMKELDEKGEFESLVKG